MSLIILGVSFTIIGEGVLREALPNIRDIIVYRFRPVHGGSESRVDFMNGFAYSISFISASGFNEDVEFTVEVEDNYSGRDIDVGVELPDDFDGKGGAKASTSKTTADTGTGSGTRTMMDYVEEPEPQHHTRRSIKRSK